MSDTREIPSYANEFAALFLQKKQFLRKREVKNMRGIPVVDASIIRLHLKKFFTRQTMSKKKYYAKVLFAKIRRIKTLRSRGHADFLIDSCELNFRGNKKKNWTRFSILHRTNSGVCNSVSVIPEKLKGFFFSVFTNWAFFPIDNLM